MKRIIFTLMFVFILASAVYANGAVKYEAINEALTPSGMSYSSSFFGDNKLQTIMLHGSTTLTEDITIKLDSVLGSSYDTVLRVISFSSNTDYVWYPDGEIIIHNGDKISITSTYNDTSATVKGIVQVEELS